MTIEMNYDIFCSDNFDGSSYVPKTRIGKVHDNIQGQIIHGKVFYLKNTYGIQSTNMNWSETDYSEKQN